MRIRPPRLSNARRQAEREAFMQTHHTYQLMRGQGDDAIPFGDPKPMTGAEAARLNKELEQKFYRSRDPQARLWRWTCMDNPRKTTETLRRGKVRSFASIMAEPEVS